MSGSDWVVYERNGTVPLVRGAKDAVSKFIRRGHPDCYALAPDGNKFVYVQGEKELVPMEGSEWEDS